MSTGPEEIEPLEPISPVAHERSPMSLPVPTAEANGAPHKRVADIVKGNHVSDGEIIEFVFFRRANYAIYRAAGRIRVQCADDEAIGTEQATMISELLPLSFRLEDRLKHVDDPRPYHWQIAEALRLGLDGQARTARMVFQAATNELAAVVMIERRLKYVISAGIAAALCVAAAAIAFLLRLQYPQAASAWDHVLLAAAAGATGALISQTIRIRSHHFDESPNFDESPTITPADAVARVLIGSTAGAIILLLLNSGTLDIQIAGMRLTNVTTWQNALLVGFAAGFLERLVPNSIYVWKIHVR